MTSQINEWYPFDLQAEREPSWARDERLAYCESGVGEKRQERFMNSLREALNRFFH